MLAGVAADLRLHPLSLVGDRGPGARRRPGRLRHGRPRQGARRDRRPAGGGHLRAARLHPYLEKPELSRAFRDLLAKLGAAGAAVDAGADRGGGQAAAGDRAAGGALRHALPQPRRVPPGAGRGGRVARAQQPRARGDRPGRLRRLLRRDERADAEPGAPGAGAHGDPRRPPLARGPGRAGRAQGEGDAGGRPARVLPAGRQPLRAGRLRNLRALARARARRLQPGGRASSASSRRRGCCWWGCRAAASRWRPR